MDNVNKNNLYHYNKELQPLANKLRKSMTKAEACLWKYALRARMMRGYSFRRQRPVLNYIVDFMCKELFLIIEVDGYSHLLDEVVEKDQRKDRDLHQIGFHVLRFTDEEILKDINQVIRVIEDYIERFESNQKTTP